MAKSKITTGQYVELTQTPASVGDRLLATAIDWMVIWTYAFLILVFFVFVLDRHISHDIEMVLYFLLQVPVLLYFPLCEIFTNGQSIGKKTMKTRVVMVDGSTPTIGAYLMRWLLYPIDTFITGGFGLVFVLFSKNAQRLGDLAAGTMVTKINDHYNAFLNLGHFNFVQQGYVPTYPDAANFSMKQVDIITRTLFRSSPENRNELTFRLAGQVQKFLDVQVPRDLPADVFLNTALNDYYYYTSNIEV